MREFRIEVNETVVNRVIYTVQARNAREAEAKASIGDTVDEEFVKTEGVTHREIQEIIGESDSEEDEG